MPSKNRQSLETTIKTSPLSSCVWHVLNLLNASMITNHRKTRWWLDHWLNTLRLIFYKIRRHIKQSTNNDIFVDAFKRCELNAQWKHFTFALTDLIWYGASGSLNWAMLVQIFHASYHIDITPTGSETSTTRLPRIESHLTLFNQTVWTTHQFVPSFQTIYIIPNVWSMC